MTCDSSMHGQAYSAQICTHVVHIWESTVYVEMQLREYHVALKKSDIDSLGSLLHRTPIPVSFTFEAPITPVKPATWLASSVLEPSSAAILVGQPTTTAQPSYCTDCWTQPSRASHP